MATKKANEAEPVTAEVVEAEHDLWFAKTFGVPWEGGTFEKYVHYVHEGFCEECGIPVYSNRNKPYDATDVLEKEHGAGLALWDPEFEIWMCHKHAPKDRLMYETLGECTNCGRLGFVVRTDVTVPESKLPASEHARIVGDQFATILRTAKNEPPQLICGRCQPYTIAEVPAPEEAIALNTITNQIRAQTGEQYLQVKLETEQGREPQRKVF